MLDAPIWPEVDSEIMPGQSGRAVPRWFGRRYFTAKKIRAADDACDGSGKMFALTRRFVTPTMPVRAYLQLTGVDTVVVEVNGRSVGELGYWRKPLCVNLAHNIHAGTNVLTLAYRSKSPLGGVMGELFLRYLDGSYATIETDETFLSADGRPAVAEPGPGARPWKDTLLPYCDMVLNDRFPLKAMQPACEPDVPFPGAMFQGPIATRVGMVGGIPQFFLNGSPFFAMWGSVPPNCTRVYLTGHARFGDSPINLITVNDYHFYKWWVGDGKYDFADLDRRAALIGKDNPDAYFIWDIDLYPPQEWVDRHPGELCVDDRAERIPSGRYTAYSFASPVARAAMKDALAKVIEHVEQSPYANRVFGYRINSGTTIEWLGWNPKPGRVTDFSPAAKKAFADYARARGYPEIVDVPARETRRSPVPGRLLWDVRKHMDVILWNDFCSESNAGCLIEMCAHAKQQLKGRKVVGTYYGYTMTLNDNNAAQHRAHFALKRVLDSGAVDFLCSPQAYRARQIGDTNTDMKPFKTLQDRGIVSVVEDDSRTHNMIWNGLGSYQTVTRRQSVDVLNRNSAIALCRGEPIYFYPICFGSEFDFEEYAATSALNRIVGEHCLSVGARRTAEIAVIVSEKSITALPQQGACYENAIALQQEYQFNGTVRTTEIAGAVFGKTTFGDNLLRWARCGAPVDYLLAEDLATSARDYKVYAFVNCFRYDAKLLAAVERLRQKDCTILWLYAPGALGGDVGGLEGMRRLTGMDFANVTGGGQPVAVMRDGRKLGPYTYSEDENQNPAPLAITPLFTVVGADEVWGSYIDEKPAVALKKTGSATTVFSGTWQVDLPFLRQLLNLAGVRIVSDDGDPIEANDRLVTLHARSSGRKTIRLPHKADVLDVYARKVIAEDVSSFSFDATLHSTHLFYYGADARELLRKLEDGQ